MYTLNGTNGASPNPPLLGLDGELLGTTAGGGVNGLGVVFDMANIAKYSLIYQFAGGPDGSSPSSALIEAFDRSFYGVTQGTSIIPPTVYKLTPSGSLISIYTFTQGSGSNPNSIMQATDGNLYGTTYAGGANNCGTLFKLTTLGSLAFTYSFPCFPAVGGMNPTGPLLEASDGNLYGITVNGGSGGVGLGAVLRLTKAGTVSILYGFKGFTGGQSDGENPYGGLVQGTDGYLYGTTLAGGANNLGTLFQLSTDGAYKQLYSFDKITGNQPAYTLLQHTTGRFYGSAIAGGQFNYGTAFSLNIGLQPFVSLVRARGHVGDSAQLLGQGFIGTTSVTFNGVQATSFTVVSDTYLTAVVPSGAGDGRVVVTTPTGTLISNRDFVTL
jgi:uncharacterized repeat protein (TIGR03803 family)